MFEPMFECIWKTEKNRKESGTKKRREAAPPQTSQAGPTPAQDRAQHQPASSHLAPPSSLSLIARPHLPA